MRTRGGLQNGVFGAAVACLVLLSSVAIAFLGNTDSHDVQTTEWNYVTSANPAFSYDKAPARVDYSPPANYTGYSTHADNFDYTGGVTYTSSALPTAYAVKKEPVVTASGSRNYTDLHNNGLDILPRQSPYLSLNKISIGSSVETMVSYSPAGILTAANLTSDTLWNYLSGAPLAEHSIVTFTSNNDNVFFAIKSWGDHWVGVEGDAYPKLYLLLDPQTYDKISVDADTDTATLYSDDVSLLTAPLADVIICYANVDGTQTDNSLPNLTLDYTAVIWSRDYMNPIYGVSPIPASRVYWSNGYDNASVDLLVQSFDGTLGVGPLAGNPIFVQSNGVEWGIGGVLLGRWPAMIISYDMDNGVTVRPVSSFNNFNSYTEAGTEIVITNSAPGPISTLYFDTYTNLNMAVVQTTVYVEGGGIYRVDSELNVYNKFPGYDTYNITISGASHWGDGLTINGITYAVDPDAGTVNIGGKAFPLAGLVLAYSENTYYYRGAVYDADHLVVINGDLVTDLGAAHGLILGFAGTWYYETQFYEGVAGTVSVIDWAPGVLGLEPAAFSAVFTLLSLVGLVLAVRLGGGTWDYLVLGSAVLIGFIMCGVFI